MRKWLLMGIMVCLVGVMNAQEKAKPFMRLGVGTSLSPEFVKGFGGDLEAGVAYKGFELSADFMLYSTFTLGGASVSLQTLSGKGLGPTITNNVTEDLDGERSTSVFFTVGYDLMRFIRGNERHHLIPSIGLGWSGRFTVDGFDGHYTAPDGDQVQDTRLLLHHASTFDVSFGGRYEYSINDHWGIGLTYKYYKNLDRDYFGAHAVYHF